MPSWSKTIVDQSNLLAEHAGRGACLEALAITNSLRHLQMEEIAILRELEVDLGQGYLLARPARELRPFTVMEWLAELPLTA